MVSIHPVSVSHAAPFEIPDRYEMKYLISESQVESVRRAIAPYCVLDAHCEGMPNCEYGIQSLYLDTPNRDLFRISRQRRARRWKARVRRYDASDRVFLEVKNKDHDLVQKQRAHIPLDGWAERLHGELGVDDGQAESFFRQRLERHGLQPMLMVRYLREAWMSTVDSYARVTFDRRITCQAWAEWSLDVDDANWLALDSARSTLSVPRAVVLELKCLTAVPRWLSSVVQDVGLVRVRYSKYCRGIERQFARDTLLGVLHQT